MYVTDEFGDRVYVDAEDLQRLSIHNTSFQRTHSAPQLNSNTPPMMMMNPNSVPQPQQQQQRRVAVDAVPRQFSFESSHSYPPPLPPGRQSRGILKTAAPSPPPIPPPPASQLPSNKRYHNARQSPVVVTPACYDVAEYDKDDCEVGIVVARGNKGKIPYQEDSSGPCEGCKVAVAVGVGLGVGGTGGLVGGLLLATNPLVAVAVGAAVGISSNMAFYTASTICEQKNKRTY
eukprot:PhF_6_TR23996/c0_g1_i1/m.33600